MSAITITTVAFCVTVAATQNRLTIQAAQGDLFGF
jgi:hypothetical protein